MGLFDFFKMKKREYEYARMLNGQTPVFSQFGDNIYASDVVQQAIYCIVSEMKKLSPRHVLHVGADTISPNRRDVQTVLNNPNPLMTTSEFIEKCVWLLFLHYNVFILPVFSEEQPNRLIALYPLNPSQVDFLQDPSQTLYVKLSFPNGEDFTVSYDRIIHWKYRYSINGFMGGNENGEPDNSALLKTLELNDILLQGVAKALKSSFSINGVIKYNTLLDGDKTEAAIKELEKQIAANASGFLPLDLKGEFIPFQKQIQLVDDKTLQFIDSKILRHYGVSLPILSGDFTADQLAAFYQKTIEPLIIGLNQVFTKGIFTPTERSFGNAIEFCSEELIFMNTTQKLELVRLLGDSGTLYENEKRRIFGLPTLPELAGIRLQSLNYVDVKLAAQYQVQQKENDEGEENEK